MAKNMFGIPVSEESINRRYQQLQGRQKQSAQTSGSPVQEQPHHTPPPSGGNGCPMHSDLMTFTTLLESLSALYESIGEASAQEDPMEGAVNGSQSYDEDEVLTKLEKLFLPVLVSQGFESDIADQMKSECAQADVLTEKNVLKFDDESRMAQLISVCALLIQQAKNTEKYRSYVKAAQIRNQLKLEMQKEEYSAAKALAQKFLVKVSTSNNSSVARKAASDLLPQTQH